MSDDHHCPYCLQRVRNTGEAPVIEADEPLAGFIGLDEDAAVHEDCYLNAADRA